MDQNLVSYVLNVLSCRGGCEVNNLTPEYHHLYNNKGSNIGRKWHHKSLNSMKITMEPIPTMYTSKKASQS